MSMKTKIFDVIEQLQDLLEEGLPETDPQHREELLDIASLLQRRTEMYIENYGCND